MPTPDTTEPAARGAAGQPAGLPARLLWFAGIWALSVAALAGLAVLIRWLIGL